MVRGLYLLKLDWNTVGGFRVASRPALLGGWREGMRALEKAASEATQVLMRLPPEELARPPEALRTLHPPRIGRREGFMDAFCVQESAERSMVVTRAVFRFRCWPLGGWVVFAAFRRGPEGTDPITDEELDELW